MLRLRIMFDWFRWRMRLALTIGVSMLWSGCGWPSFIISTCTTCSTWFPMFSALIRACNSLSNCDRSCSCACRI